MVKDLFYLVLEFYRHPLDFPDLKDARCPLPTVIDSLEEVLDCVLSRDRATLVARDLAVSVDVLQEAVFFFLRQVLFTQEGGHHRVLGVREHASRQQIKAHYRLLIKVFHPDTNFSATEDVEAYSARLNVAYGVLYRGALDRSVRKLAYEKSDVPEKFASRIQSHRIRFPTKRGISDALKPFHPLKWARIYRSSARWIVLGLIMGTMGLVWMLIQSPPMLRVAETNQRALSRYEINAGYFVPGESRSQIPSATFPTQDQIVEARPIGWGRSEGKSPNISSPKDNTTSPSKQDSPMDAGQRPTQQGQVRDLSRHSSGQIGTDYPVKVLSQDGIRKSPESIGKYLAMEVTKATRQGGQAQNFPPHQTLNEAKETAHAPRLMADKEVKTVIATTSPPSMSPSPVVGNQGTKPLPSKMPASQQVFDTKPIKINGFGYESNHGEQVGTSMKLLPADLPTISTETHRSEGDIVLPQPLEKKIPESPGVLELSQPRESARASISKVEMKPVRSAVPTHELNRIITELERAFVQGDLKAFTRPFSDNCKLTEGSGRDFLLDDYARLFANTDQRWLKVKQLNWSLTDNGDYYGQGTFETKILSRETWSYTKGKIRFHLVGRGDTYEIESLFHEVNQFQQEGGSQ